MRLLAIRPANFRAFGPSDWISLDSDLVVCSGANGAGKTSLAEAVEWLLFGETMRRRRGEGFSKVEYRGSYANVHGAGPVEVSARVSLPDGTERTVTRRLVTGSQGAESTLTFVDGRRERFCLTGTDDGRASYPVATQHGLQDFVHSGPKERRDAFCAIVGLAPLTAFKSALDRARLSLQRTLPAEAASARSAARALREKMAWHPVTAAMAGEWDEDFKGAEFTQHWSRLLRAAQQEVDTRENDPSRLVNLLRARRQLAVHSIFDLDRFRPASDLPAHLDAIEARREDLGQAILSLVTSVERLATIGTGSVGPELLGLWQSGLRIAEAGGQPTCPVCGQDTLTRERRELLRTRLSMHRECAEARAEAARSVRSLRECISGLCAQVRTVLPKAPDRPSRTGSSELTAGAAAALEAYLSSLGELLGKWEGTEAAMSGYCQDLDRLGQMVDAPESALGFMEGLRSRDLEQAPDDFLAIANGVEELAALFPEVETRLTQELLSGAEVRRIDALIAGLEIRPHLAVISAYNRVREEAAAESRALEEAIQTKERALLSRLRDAIRGYYDLLNPNASTRFSAIEPTTGAVRLLAESFGEQMSATACLSTSQLNSLGLALHLARAADPSSPFGFVVLDDPFQAMDDERCENLIKGVLPRLLDGAGKQVIVLTHRGELARRVCEAHACRRPLLYRVEMAERWAAARQVDDHYLRTRTSDLSSRDSARDLAPEE